MLLELRPKAKAAMIAAARRQPGFKILHTSPFLRRDYETLGGSDLRPS